MYKALRKFLSKVIVAIVCISLAGGALANTDVANLPMPEVGDHGAINTETNKDILVKFLKDDLGGYIGKFGNQALNNIVPIEAKVGLTFMNALSKVSNILYTALIPFVTIFIIIAYAFWIAFETYNMMTTGKGEIKKLFTDIVRKGAIIAIWLIILQNDPVKIFMTIMSPILGIATYISDLILNAITSVAGVTLADTCSAIKDYVATHISADNIITSEQATALICVPTRASTFCYTAIIAGLKWLMSGIGHSVFVTLCGLYYIYMFLKVAWKFAFMGLGVIADLFLGVMMLPFTAINETVGKTSFKGLAGDMFNGFLNIFSTESLQKQIDRLVNAAIYFVSLAIVIAFCAALLSSVVTLDLNALPTIDNTGFWMTALVAGLTLHFANKAADIAKDLGGSIDKSMGDAAQKDVEGLYKSTKNQISSWYKAIKDSRK